MKDLYPLIVSFFCLEYGLQRTAPAEECREELYYHDEGLARQVQAVTSLLQYLTISRATFGWVANGTLRPLHCLSITPQNAMIRRLLSKKPLYTSRRLFTHTARCSEIRDIAELSPRICPKYLGERKYS